MSSSSSYSSSSPPSSPQCPAPASSGRGGNIELHRLNSDTILKTIKIKTHQMMGVDKMTEADASWGTPSSSLDDKTTVTSSSNNTTTTAHDSSKESLNNEFTSQEMLLSSAKNSGDSVTEVLLAEAAKNASIANDTDIEATYITSMSKNLITLRKTESLKLDSVQSIRYENIFFLLIFTFLTKIIK